MDATNDIMQYLPFLLPIILIQMALMITALVHVLKHKNYRFGNRILWVVIVVCFQLLGPIVYFTIGRGDNE